MSFPEVFEPNIKTELNRIPSKSEMERVGLGTSWKERNEYRWTGKTYQNVNDINYNKFINPKTNKPYPFTETLQNVKEVGSNVVNQVGNVFKSKPVQFFLDQTGLNAAEQIFNEGSISAYNFTKQFVPFKSEIKQGASFAATKYEEGITGLSQQLNVHPDITELSLTALEMFGPGAAKNIAKKKLVSNLNDLTKFVPPSRQVAVAGGGSFNAASIFKSVDTTGMFTSQSTTEQIIKDWKKASRGFDIPKLEKSIKKSIKKHKLPATLEDYIKVKPKNYNKYINDELRHWAEHGTGSGKPFPIKHKTNPDLNINYRLDNKSNPSKILDDSGKVIDKSFSITDLLNKKIQNLSQTDRLIILQNTTLDQATVSKVAKLTPGGRIMHHAAPVQSTGKIRDAFFKANPKLTQKDWRSIQRKVEKELGIAFGDSPLNQRYPKTIAEHNEYHKLLDDAKLYPRQLKFPEGLSPDAAYKKLKELGTTVLEIDKKIGIEPTYTSKTIGKEFR
jgi:hypothetical protein